MTKTCLPSFRELVKAICFPSGENAGLPSAAVWRVSCRAPPPAVGTDQMSPFQAKATIFPSGERAGDDGIRIRRASAAAQSERQPGRENARANVRKKIVRNEGENGFIGQKLIALRKSTQSFSEESVS